jgi:putative ABC transport system permease protein
MYALLDAVTLALGSVWAHKLRSFMMVLGNIVAVMSIIAVVSLIQGMNFYVGEAIEREVGVGTFRIDKVGIVSDNEKEREAWRRNPNITLNDMKAIRRWSPLFRAMMTESGARSNVSWHEVTLEDVRIRGVSPEYQEFVGYSAVEGRVLSPMEVQRNRPVVLLGAETAKKLFGTVSALDHVIRLGGTHFRVVGVNERKGSMFGESQDDFAVIPLGKLRQLFGTRRSLSINVKPTDPSRLAEAMDDARLAMRIRHKLRPRDKDDFGLFTADTMMEVWRKFSQGAFAILIGIVSLSLVVGGIVIMNIMLMVVSERTREIGLRRALGARRRDIVWQVLTESTTLSIVGGLIGTIAGFAVALVVEWLSPLPAAIKPWSVVLGIGMTAFVGLFFGLYPALRAAKLDPIEALRRE